MDLKSNLKYLILISIISISAFFTINYFVELKVDSIKKDKFSTISNNVKMLIDQAIEDKIYSTLNLAISISEYASSHQLLSKQNKEELKNLKNISMKIEKNSNFRNLWIHVVDAKGISRYRNWSEKSGDYLLNVRKELIPLLEKPKIVNVISVGIFDISFKSIVPIYEGEKFMGLIETITKFNSIAKKFQEKRIDFLILVDKKYKEQIKKPFSKLFIDDYYVANINAKKELLNLTRNNLTEFLNMKNYEINSNKFITRYEIKDFKNNEMANILTFQDYNKIFLNEIQSLENSLRIIGYLSTLIIIAIFSTYYYFNKSKYTKTLEKEVKNRTKALNQLIIRYKQLFEGSRAIKIVVDPQSMNIFDANKAALDFYGYSKEEIKKLKSSDININIKENENIFKDILKEQKNIFYFKHKLASGKIRDVEVYSSLIDVDNKKLIYSIIRDVTEELKLKKEFEEKQKLFYQQAKMASMGEMLENIAHQWRQPLSTITTAASG
jgi:PAS domain S-box-containing protein